MDDREAVAAILAGDTNGLAAVYDRYAAPLYGYCRTLLAEPADAADAVQDTFAIAASRVDALRDASKLRPWLYAVARNECRRKLSSREAPAEIEVSEDESASADVWQSTQHRELRELMRAAISGLNPPDREVIELNLRHDLDGAELAAVLGVSRSHAHAMASRARAQLEKSLGALLVARTGRRACPLLDELLADWDGGLTILLRKRVSRHIEHCEECGERKSRALRPAMLYGLPALPVLPPGLRQQVLRLCAGQSPAAPETQAGHTGSFGPDGFPRPLQHGGKGWRDPGAGIVSAVSVAAAAAVIIAMIALRGAPPSTLDAHSGTGAATPSVATGPGLALAPSPRLDPSSAATRIHRHHTATKPRIAITPPVTLVPSPPKPKKSAKPTASPTQSPSPSPSASASPSPSPSPSTSTSPSPTNSPTPTTSPPAAP